MIFAYQPLQTFVNGTRRPVVLEVTEQTEIADHETFRAAVADLGPKPKLAVDDAGAGFASFRHILELRPAYIKLDRSLIADLESDQARQAMIVDLRHFARSVGASGRGRLREDPPAVGRRDDEPTVRRAVAIQ
jgi:EAL domain-containing protein (putative c-di-GMP-specific phosphodiesterase class I)